MKKLVVLTGIVLALIVGAVLVLPSLVPADRVKSEIVAQVKAATGRDLSIDGKVSVSVLPSLSVEVANVALSNPPGFAAKDLVRLGAVDVKLKLLPLLSGAVEVDSFVLIDPVVSLEIDKRGKANWDFGGGQGKASGGSTSPGSIGDIRLGEVAIRNGRMTYVDARSGAREEITDVNLAVDLPSLDSPLAVKGGLKWRDEAIDLRLNASRPRALMEGAGSPVVLAVEAKPLGLNFTGIASTQPSAEGDLHLSVPSVRNLAQWAGGVTLGGAGFGPFSLNGKLAASGDRIALSQADLALDAVKAAGDFTLATGGARPSLKGKLAVENLDITPYLPPETEAKPSAASTPADWSDAPIDASGLKAADVDFALTANSIKVRAIEIGRSALRVRVDNGRMVADLSELALYGGAGKGRLVLDGSQTGLGLDATFALDKLQAAPFLTAAAGFDRLEGTGSADLTLAGRGRTERQLVGALNGRGAVTFTDGAIRGINIAAMVRNVTTAFADTSGSQKTDFAELSGTFTITDGLASNLDLKLLSPLLRVEGSGSADLPRRTLRYRVEPKAVASLQGQGGQADLGGIMVPVIVEGPWHALTFRPDLETMVKGQAEKALKGFLGGGTQPAEAEQTKPALPLPIDPGRLFGR